MKHLINFKMTTHITFWNNIKRKYPDTYNNWCPTEFKKQKQFHFPQGVFKHILGFIGDPLPKDTIKYSDESKEAVIETINKRVNGVIITKTIWSNICDYCKCASYSPNELIPWGASGYPRHIFYGCMKCRNHIGFYKNDYIMKFGKHKGKTWYEMSKDKGYLKWFINNVDREKSKVLYDYILQRLQFKNKPKLKYFVDKNRFKKKTS